MICTLPCWPSPLLSGSTLPRPFPVWIRYTVFTYTGGGGYMGFCWRPYSSENLRSVSDQIQNLKIARPPQKHKPGRGGGLRQINTCRKAPLQVNFALPSLSLIYLRFIPSIISISWDFPFKIRCTNTTYLFGSFLGRKERLLPPFIYIGWNPTSEAKPEEIIVKGPKHEIFECGFFT
jgi:hypothetical protein